ncbi:MAG: J domain-containing protein [Prochloron sp. SP5CPC1]|nr:J domain-containing protein [Candidatus Paraprochloron terpiosi SP5CPC1]
MLQVSNDATIEEIKAAFRRLARQYHPDLHPNHPRAIELNPRFLVGARIYFLIMMGSAIYLTISLIGRIK